MRLSTITNWAYGSTVVLALLSGTTMLLASRALDDQQKAVAQRYVLDHASSTIGSEITVLSDQAREYVMTGEPSHLALYKSEASVVRPSEAGLRRIKDKGAKPEELEALTAAVKWADDLRDEQEAATKLRENGNEDGARRILFGPDYDRQLDRIAVEVEKFQYRLDQRTDAEVTAATSVARLWKAISEAVLAITGLLFFCVLYFVFKKRVLRPVVKLSDVVNRLAAQDYDAVPPQFDQIDEIGDMAQAIRVFRDNGIERQRLEKEQSADLTMRTLLSRMTQRLQACDTLHALERVVENFVPEIIPQFAGCLYIYDETRNALVQASSWHGELRSTDEFPPTACWGLQRGDLHRPAGDAIDISCEHTRSGKTVDSICLPLVAQRKTLGLLYLEVRTDRPAVDEDISDTYLKMLGENISLALGNLRLRSALQEMAMADALTGLANRRHLDAVLQTCISDAELTGKPVSCLMVDVDHFKRFNDRFGHEAGDAVLRAMGELLKHSTREKTVAFRYGGEEFLLLMPELGPEQALARAEEIQARVRALSVKHAGVELGSITASFGLATAPDHSSFVKLIETADAALYRAKEAGRDRIVAADARWTDQRIA